MTSTTKYSKLRTAGENRSDESLPLWRKLCFAIGGVPYQVTSNVIGFFLTVFLLESAQLPPWYVSIILFSGKAWDAITDPAIGILVYKTNSRWGKMRPWIIFPIPFACATYFFLFYVPWGVTFDSDGKEEVDASDPEKFAFYFAMFCLFEGFLSCLHVPYTAMTMYVATKQKDRDSITAIRMCFEAIGVLAAVLIQGSFVSSTRCTGKDGNEEKEEPSLETQHEAYKLGSFVVIGLYVICCLITFFGSKEKKGIFMEDEEDRSFWRGLKLVFTFKPFLWASLVFLFMYMGLAINQGNIALYVSHTLGMGDQLTYFIGLLLGVSIVAIPIWQLIAQKFGKKTAYACGIILMIPAQFVQLYLPKGVYWPYYTSVVFFGLSLSVAFLLPWSVLPDVLDLYMLQKNARHDSLFYSFYVFLNKFATGIALAVSQVVLEFGGYVSGQCDQPEELADTLRYLMSPVPVICLLIALFALYKYPIDENQRRLIRQRINELTVEYEETVVRSSRSYESIRSPENSVSLI